MTFGGGGGSDQSSEEESDTASEAETTSKEGGSQEGECYWGPISTIGGFTMGQKQEGGKEKEESCQNREEDFSGKLPHKALFMLRYHIPKTNQSEVMQEGWVGIRKLQEYGILIDEYKAEELIEGMGG